MYKFVSEDQSRDSAELKGSSDLFEMFFKELAGDIKYLNYIIM